MKPYLLRLQAFGPFADTVTIPFNRIHSGGLFLIHGSTGSGKTSILDGMTFALFGRSSSAERDKDLSGLRADSASAKVATECEFLFSIGPDFYRILRRPSQSIEKLKGQGLRDMKSQAELFKFNGHIVGKSTSETTAALHRSENWEPLALKVDQTNQKIEELLGMTEKQFRQIVLLPQGKFREFLSASSTARQEILERLFQTERFTQFEKFLNTKAKQLQNEELRLEIQLQTLWSSLPEPVRTGFETTPPLSLCISTLDRFLQNQKIKSDELDLALAALTQSEQKLDGTLREQQQKLKSIEILEMETENLKRHRNNLTAMKDLEHRVELNLRHATTFASLLLLEERRESLKTNQEQRSLLQHQQRSLEEKREALRLTILEKQKAFEQASWPDAVQQALESFMRSYSKLLTKKTELKASDDALQRSRQVYQYTLSQKKAIVDQLKKEVHSAERFVERSLSRLTVSIDGIEKQLSQTQSEERRFWIKKLTLEGHIDPHHTCPVCGSQGAAIFEEIPCGNEQLRSETHTDDMVQSLLNEKLQLEKRRSNIESLWNLTKRQLPKEPFTEEIGPNEPLSRLDNNTKTTNPDLDEAEAHKLVSHLGTLISQHSSKTETLENLKAEGLALKARYTETDSSFNEMAQCLREQITQLESEQKGLKLPSVRLDLSASEEDLLRLEQWVKHHAQLSRDQARELDQIKSQFTECEHKVAANREKRTFLSTEATNLRRQIDTLESEINTAITQVIKESNSESGPQFQAPAETQERMIWFKSVQLSPSDLKGARAELEAYRAKEEQILKQIEWAASIVFEGEKLDSLWNRLEVDHLAGLRSHYTESLNQIGEELKKQGDDRLRKQTDRDEVRSLILQSERARAGLIEIEKQRVLLSDNYAVTLRLSSLLKGDRSVSSSGVPLSRYVLQTRFDQVLEYANLRLKEMSRGQFLLRRAHMTAKLSQSQGLALEVEDLLTGSRRQADSLSGGESFMASLALALGLADAVQSELGGIQIESVFIDEGFGTLDPEALDLAIQTLVHAQSLGRVVGIISHVAELKEQIPTRLEVIRPNRFDNQRIVRWADG